jgi:hypothetical protein
MNGIFQCIPMNFIGHRAQVVKGETNQSNSDLEAGGYNLTEDYTDGDIFYGSGVVTTFDST